MHDHMRVRHAQVNRNYDKLTIAEQACESLQYLMSIYDRQNVSALADTLFTQDIDPACLLFATEFV